MRLLFVSDEDDPAAWKRALTVLVAGLDFVIWTDEVDPASVDAALCFKPPPGLLRSVPRLRLVQSLAAGLDHLDGDRAPVPEVSVFRLEDPGVSPMIAEYVLAASDAASPRI
jgi:glyoxylate/hydroxypyruvate reductase A